MDSERTEQASTELAPELAWSSEDIVAKDAVAGPPAHEVSPQSQPWIGVISLAGITLIAAAMILGGVMAWFHFSPRGQPVASVPTTSQVPQPAPQLPVTTAVVLPPPLTVTVAPPAPPVVTTSLPPLATPEARVAEPIICSLHNRYPQMQPVDLALSLIDRGIYRSYDEALVVVNLVLADGCHGI